MVRAVASLPQLERLEYPVGTACCPAPPVSMSEGAFHSSPTRAMHDGEVVALPGHLHPWQEVVSSFLDSDTAYSKQNAIYSPRIERRTEGKIKQIALLLLLL